MEIDNNTDKILLFLKKKENATALQIATELDITKEGARQLLLKMINEGLILTEQQKTGIGRPTVFFSLSEKGLEHFPNKHADVAVQLLSSVRNLLGENALLLLLNNREKQLIMRYENAMKGAKSTEEKLTILAEIRTKEGYMAEWRKEEDDYVFTENHCPICSAATEFQGFCKAEFNSLEYLFSKTHIVERIQHLLSGSKKCEYKISPKR
jgi:predicted ArsR family transcriptional regulator